MTYIKMCGLTRMSDITAVNSVKPEYIGFVFYEKSKRYITPSKAVELKGLLSPEIKAVGVFVNESAEVVAGLLESGVIDIAQLHGDEDEEYISGLRRMTDKPIIQAFRIRSAAPASSRIISPLLCRALSASAAYTRRVKTVFMAMRHAMDNMQARQECMDIMRELFRQFMSVLIQERTRIEKYHICLDPRISFQEIDTYFFSGCACAYFQIAVDIYTDLRYNKDEWQD